MVRCHTLMWCNPKPLWSNAVPYSWNFLHNDTEKRQFYLRSRHSVNETWLLTILRGISGTSLNHCSGFVFISTASASRSNWFSPFLINFIALRFRERFLTGGGFSPFSRFDILNFRENQTVVFCNFFLFEAGNCSIFLWFFRERRHLDCEYCRVLLQ